MKEYDNTVNDLAIAIYITLSTHAITLISKTDARTISDLLAEYYKHKDITAVVKSIVQGIYESDDCIEYELNLPLISKWIRKIKY